MRRWPIFILLGTAFLAAAFLGGYATREFALNPVDGLLHRIEAKIQKMWGAPDETERHTAVIESTFLRLRGKVYTEPERDFVSGGAMTVWGDDLLILDHAGKVFVFDPEKGLVPLAITAPDNGLDAYRAIIKTEKYRTYSHKPDRVRFNDLQYVAAPDGTRGLALSYTYFDGARECYVSRVSWRPLIPAETTARHLTVRADEWQTLFDTYPCMPLNRGVASIDGIFAGGRMVFKAPSTLYFGSGFYGLDGIHAPDPGLQSDDNAYGKVIAIDILTSP